MFKPLLGLVLALAVTLCSIESLASTANDWTILVFMNGHNNLDDYGQENINSMARVGSSDRVNVVVQWASLQNVNTRRVYVKKGGYDVIQDMAPVDMGSYQSLIDFAKWGVQNYPAQKYMIVVWDHGNGWHFTSTSGSQLKPLDISYDDLSKNVITTEQLGLALDEISKFTGGKIELYGSDACLMAMAEVAGQMTDSVKYFAGSEETEPMDGWPYGPWLAEVTAHPSWDGAAVGKSLARQYKDAYSSGGDYERSQVTFSVWDMAKLPAVYAAIKTLGQQILAMNPADLKKVRTAISSTSPFASPDYKDLQDFTEHLGRQKLAVGPQALMDVKEAMHSVVLENDVTSRYDFAHGMSIWLPGGNDYKKYAERYQGMEFAKQTGWGDVLEKVISDF